MATQLNLSLPSIVLAFIFLIFPAVTNSDDTCPYPCYPPPTGTGTATPTIPSTPSQTASYSPPAYYSPPAGYYPYNPPPPYGNNFYGVSPPPPDPILPYFPFYYKEPLHEDPSNGDVNSAINVQRSEFVIAIAVVFIFLSLFSI